MSKRCAGIASITLVLVLTAASCSSSSKHSASPGATPTSTATVDTAGNTASDTGVTATSVKVGYIFSGTGLAASSYGGAPNGAKARFDLENAKGGVNGRKLELVTADDQTNPNQFVTDAKDLVENKNVFGVMPISSLTFAGASYLNSKGIPVTGSAFDGPEWGQQPNSNMFTFVPPFSTVFDGQHHNYTYYGKFLNSIGVTKLAGLAYGISPSSQESVKGIYAGSSSAGIQNCYQNLSVPFGAVDFTAAALAIKSKGCDVTVGALVDSSNLAIAQAEKNAGISSKLWFLQGYDQQTLDSAAARATLNGMYVGTSVVFDPNVPAVKTMLDALATYGGFKPGDIPNFGTWTSWAAADLFIRGLKEAGKNPTRQSFISRLRQLNSYDVGGLLPIAVDFSTFGTLDMFPKEGCTYFVQLQGDKFVRASVGADGKVCGERVAY